MLTFIVTFVDQFLKYMVRSSINEDYFIDTFIPFLKIGYIKNTGAALGMFPGQRIFLVLFSIVVMSYLFYFASKKKARSFKVLFPLAFLAGGGISNLIDRIFFGYVTDYLKVTFFSPICNLADYFISIGIILIIININHKK